MISVVPLPPQTLVLPTTYQIWEWTEIVPSSVGCTFVTKKAQKATEVDAKRAPPEKPSASVRGSVIQV